MKKLIVSTTLLTLGYFAAAPAVIAEEDEPRWFEIEVIVFKSTSQNGMFTESWDNDHQVEFSDNLVDFLQPYADLNDEQDLMTIIGEFLVNEDPDAKLVDNKQLANENSSPQTSTNDNKSALAQTDPLAQIDSLQSNPLTDPLTNSNTNQLTSDSNAVGALDEKPFELLDESLLQLTNEVKTLNRHPEYRVVVHYAWRQPVLGNRDAQHIRIAGGEDFSEDYEFNGSKKLLAEQSFDEIPELIYDEDGNIIGSQQAGYDNQDLSDSDLDNPNFNNSQLNANNENSEFQSNSQTIQTNSLGEESDSQNTRNEKSASEQLLALEDTKVALPWVPEIDGDIKVYLSRYLHIKTNLYLRKPDKEEVDLVELQIANSQQSTDDNALNPTSQENLNLFNPTSEDNQSGILGLQSTAQETQASDASGLNSSFEIPQISGVTTQDNNFILANNQLVSASGEDITESQFSWELDDNFLEAETEKMYIERLFNYPLKQSRRVKSGELHFFDHPLMGVIIMIRPYELNQEMTEQEGLLPPSM